MNSNTQTRLGPLEIATVLRRRRTQRAQAKWTPERLHDLQRRRLDALRQFALGRSRFYREFHAGLDRCPLDELPVLTKAQLMERWDDISTDAGLRLADVGRFVTEERPEPALFDGSYFVVATSGSSGRPGVFAYNRSEWEWVLASYARANDWAGVAAGLFHHLKLAVVSTTRPWHQSSVVGASLKSRLVPALRLDSTAPLPTVVAELNGYQPESLVAYASTALTLAREQLAGRLDIAPKAVFCASEVLTTTARATIAAAFGAQPFETYAATETAGVASDCSHHRMHLYEDLVITEIVDNEGRPTPPGTTGDRLLATVLFTRTLPLIRYELTDRVALSTQACDCGLPFGVLAGIEGRTQDVVTLHAAGGNGLVDVHPNVFHDALDRAPVAKWQIVQLSRERVLARVIPLPSETFDAAALQAAIIAALAAAGADAHVAIDVVDKLEHNRAGKTTLIKATKSPQTEAT